MVRAPLISLLVVGLLALAGVDGGVAKAKARPPVLKRRKPPPPPPLPKPPPPTRSPAPPFPSPSVAAGRRNPTQQAFRLLLGTASGYNVDVGRAAFGLGYWPGLLAWDPLSAWLALSCAV
jgi:hypothetical protein